jgi:hypothetical protein
MSRWTFWEWVAYASIFVAAIIIAANEGVHLAPALFERFSGVVSSPYWAFAPLVLIVLGSLILIAHELGWLRGHSRPGETVATGSRGSEQQLFTVEHVVPAHRVIEEKEYFDVTVMLRFLCGVRDATILLDIYGVGRRTIELIKKESYAQGAERRLIVARIPRETAEMAVWGSPGQTENPPLVAGSENVAVIDLQTFGSPPQRQKFRMYIKMMQIGSGTSGRFFLTDETRDLLDIEQLQRGHGMSFYSS